MKKFSVKFLFLSILLVFGFAITANATPFLLPADTPLEIKFNNLEQIDTRTTNGNPSNSINFNSFGWDVSNTLFDYNDLFGNMGNWGVLRLSSIADGVAKISPPHDSIGASQNIWNLDGTQGQIHGIFGGIQIDDGNRASGGFMDLYWSDYTGVNDPAFINADDMAGNTALSDTLVNKFIQGDFLVRLDFASGAVVGDPAVDIWSDVDVLGLGPNFNVEGKANSFANVNKSATGLWSNALDRDWFWVEIDGDGIRGNGVDETRDVRFDNRYTYLQTWDGSNLGTQHDGILGAASFDPAQAYTVVPEPGTIFLLGAGLLGFAGVLRRKTS